MAVVVYHAETTDNAGHQISVYTDATDRALVGCEGGGGHGYLPEKVVLNTEHHTLTVNCGVPTAADEYCGEVAEFDLTDKSKWVSDPGLVAMFNRVAGLVDLEPAPAAETQTDTPATPEETP
jgi:hypothetical protein